MTAPALPVARETAAPRWRWSPVWRGRETLLLALASVVLALGMTMVVARQAGDLTPEAFAPLGRFLLATWLLHVLLCLVGARGDSLLLPIVTALSGLGLIMTARLVSPALAERQALWLTIGVTLAASAYLLGRWLPRLKRYKYTVGFIGLVLVALTLVFGRDLNGSGMRWWLGVGPWVFQPSEFLKVLLAIFLAAYLDERAAVIARGAYRLGPIPLLPIPYLIPLGVMWGGSLALLVAQRDLGVAVLFFGSVLAMLYVASGRALYLVSALAAFVAAGWTIYQVFPHFRDRVVAWVDPWSVSSGIGFQPVQSMIALASGGVFGAGLGMGRPDFIPAAHTDFVFAAIGEELGFAGALGVLLLFMALIGRSFRVAAAARAPFLLLLAAGLTAVLAIQSLIILGGVLRLMPLTGVTLPFVSYGGSSVVTNYVILGILLRIASESSARVLHDHQ